MGDPIEFECAECGEPGRIDSTSLHFITSATGLDREEVLLCDDHLSELLSNVYIDLSAGSTRDRDFQAARERRQLDDAEIVDAKASRTVEMQYLYRAAHPQLGETDWVALKLPKEAKPDLKELSFKRTYAEYDNSEETWRCRLSAADVVKEHLEHNGWTVEIGPDVKQAMNPTA